MRGLALILAAALVLGACGKRGNPKPPAPETPAAEETE
jgi:hypothetical protein